MEAIEKEQLEVCERLGVEPLPSPDFLKVGISLNVKNSTIFPINGLRHEPSGDTTGWYIWGGEEFSEDPNFFVPLHVEHLKSWCPNVLKYLSLPPGYRFLLGPDNYEDIWEDRSILDV